MNNRSILAAAASCLLTFLLMFLSVNAQAQLTPDNENFEQLGEEMLYQTDGIRYMTVTQDSGKQLVFMQSWPIQDDGAVWGYRGIPGDYFNGYPNKALVYNYNGESDGPANSTAGGYGIYRMLFSEAPLSMTGQAIDTLHKLGDFKLKSMYVAVGGRFGLDATSPSTVRLNFQGLRNGVQQISYLFYFGGFEMGAGSIVEDGRTILTYSAMDKHGGRTVNFVSSEWDFLDGLWISTAGNARLPVLLDNIQFDAPSPVPPNVRSTNLKVTQEQTNEITLSWLNSGSTLNRGNRRLVLVKETNNETELPPSSILAARADEIPAVIPTRSSSPGATGLSGAFGVAATLLGDGWYCIYNDSYSNFPLRITGLSSAKQYRTVVADYNGSKGFQTFMVEPFAQGVNAIGFRTLNEPSVITIGSGPATFTEVLDDSPVPVR